MLHTKFHGNLLKGSGEEEFVGFFNIYGHNGHLGHVTSIMLCNFNFLLPTSLHPKFGSYVPLVFEKSQF